MPSFDVAGPHSGNTIVFLHGASWTRKLWLPQMKRVSGAFRVIALDLPGHGSLAGTPFAIDAAVNTVLTTIDEEAGGRALLVGSSLGGYVGIEAAARRPESVAGLVLSGASADYRGLLGLRARLNALMLRLFSANPVRRQMERSLENTPLTAAERSEIERAGFYPKAWARAFQAVAGRDFPARLHAYPGPVLILNGEYDRLNRRGEAALAAAAQNARIAAVENAGHLCSLEQPEAFSKSIRAFAREVFAAGDRRLIIQN
jgi:pimeloyl-ACP methyl ester carboxylesterase